MACAFVGAAGGFLEEYEHPVVKGAGWLVSRCAIAAGVLAGVPLVVYSVAKAVIGRGLNLLTLNKSAGIRLYSERAETRLTISLVTVSTLPLLVLSLPALVRTAYQTYVIYKNTQEVIENIRQSEVFKTLENFYELLTSLTRAEPLLAVIEGNVLEEGEARIPPEDVLPL